MFSGIIENQGEVVAVVPEDGALRLSLATGFPDLTLGESVAVNGVCLTVVRHDADGRADFFVSPETLARTSLGAAGVGTALNLERAVTLSTRLSGHLVQGHVDGVARLFEMVDDGGSRRLTLSLPGPLRAFCVEKGSIALDGISLTVNHVTDTPQGCRIGLTIIPHTWEATNLHHRRVGDRVNVESDIIAKYVERMMGQAA